MVSALRQETSLQDTAITVTAITGDSLETQQIENMEDLQFAVPTLGFQKGAYSGSGITLRGIGNFAVGNSTSSSVHSLVMEQPVDYCKLSQKDQTVNSVVT